MEISRLIAGNSYIMLNRALVKKVGADKALLLSLLLEREAESELAEDGFFLCEVGTLAEVGLSYRVQRGALLVLKSEGVLDIVGRGMPSKRYIKLNKEVLSALMQSCEESESSCCDKTSEQDMTKCHNKLLQNVRTSYDKMSEQGMKKSEETCDKNSPPVMTKCQNKILQNVRTRCDKTAEQDVAEREKKKVGKEKKIKSITAQNDVCSVNESCIEMPTVTKDSNIPKDSTIPKLSDIPKEREIYKEKESEGNKVPNQVIEHLNKVAGTRFRLIESNRRPIRARLNDGFTLEDCKTVIDKQWEAWKDTEMQMYIRPETLFRPSKFDSYLNAPSNTTNPRLNNAKRTTAYGYAQNKVSDADFADLIVDLDFVEVNDGEHGQQPSG